MQNILKWEEIKRDFKDGLLLGNGASVAVNKSFNYRSLYEEAIRLGHITEPVQDVFESFGINDFELVLRRLWQALLVNRALGISPGKVEEAYKEVQNALISTIRDIHVEHSSVLPDLELIFPFMKDFKTVISLNYDLIVYWAAMLGNKSHGRWFKDCFLPTIFSEDWKSLRDNYGAAGTTLFFYPHGNLVLTRKDFVLERKVNSSDYNNLLDSILDRWVDESEIPLFVCEGTKKAKEQTISESSYLRCVFREVLPDIGSSLVVYGWGMAEQDEHIIEQIKRAGIKRIAISVYQNDETYMEHVRRVLKPFNLAECVFFDAESAGCWNNPPSESINSSGFDYGAEV